MRQNVCMTKAQWAARERSEEIRGRRTSATRANIAKSRSSILARNRFTFNCSDAAMC